MKKIIALLLVGICLMGYAQNFQVTDPKGNPYTNGETIAVTITEEDLDPFDSAFFIELNVVNLLAAELNVKTLRTNVVSVDGMEVWVCFGTCLGPEDFEIEFAFEGDAIYSLHIKPHNNFGLCKFKLDFWTTEDKTDIMTLNVEMDVKELGIKETPNTASLSAYPNPAPANSTISVSYSLDNNETHNLVIRNLLGAEVMVLPLNPYENKVSVDISTLKQGAYFYAIENKNQMVIAKKLIVK